MPTFVREARVTSEETTSSGPVQSREQSKRAHELMEEYASMETLIEDQVRMRMIFLDYANAYSMPALSDHATTRRAR
jgi:hypothetical protein